MAKQRNKRSRTGSCNDDVHKSNHQNQSGKTSTRKTDKGARSKNMAVDVKGDEVNNPNWYFTDRQLAEMATTFSFNQFLGQDFAISENGKSIESVTTAAILAINPSIGYIHKNYPMSDGINMAGMKLYTTLSANNAKTTQYAPQDVTALILAVGSLLSYVSYVRRVFGLAFTVNQRNRFYPTQLMNALGADAEDMVKNLADYRLQFNTLLNTINQIPIPLNIAYLDKWSTIYDNVYLDSDSPMAQTIALRPYSVWRLH